MKTDREKERENERETEKRGREVDRDKRKEERGKIEGQHHQVAVMRTRKFESVIALVFLR